MPRATYDVTTAVGPVKVRLVSNLTVDGDPAWGAWDWGSREIRLESNATPETQRHALEHERCHIALEASGVQQMLSPQQNEAVCDAIATGRVAER